MPTKEYLGSIDFSDFKTQWEKLEEDINAQNEHLKVVKEFANKIDSEYYPELVHLFEEMRFPGYTMREEMAVVEFVFAIFSRIVNSQQSFALIDTIYDEMRKRGLTPENEPKNAQK